MSKKTSTSKNYSDDEGGEEYTVERILDKRVKDGAVEYLIKWEGFSLNESTWENVNNASCPELIEEFERKRKEESQTKKRKSEVPAPKPREDYEASMKGAEIVGMTTGKGGEKFFVVRFSDFSATLMPVKEGHVKLPQEALKYYEKHTRVPS